MTVKEATNRVQTSRDVERSVVKRFVQIGIFALVMAACLFISSGRLDWVMGWVYVASYISLVVVNALILLPNNREMIAERAEIKKDAKSWDKILTTILSLFAINALIVAGLNVRFEWLPQVSVAVQIGALVVALLGNGLFMWAMASNRFFSAVVRIQKERGHTVQSGGPYRYVRHPGNIAWITSTIATPLLLGSLWALIPSGIAMMLMIVRTALEDRTLQSELDGYTTYAQRVRYRLLPGVW